MSIWSRFPRLVAGRSRIFSFSVGPWVPTRWRAKSTERRERCSRLPRRTLWDEREVSRTTCASLRSVFVECLLFSVFEVSFRWWASELEVIHDDYISWLIGSGWVIVIGGDDRLWSTCESIGSCWSMIDSIEAMCLELALVKKWISQRAREKSGKLHCLVILVA